MPSMLSGCGCGRSDCGVEWWRDGAGRQDSPQDKASEKRCKSEVVIQLGGTAFGKNLSAKR